MGVCIHNYVMFNSSFSKGKGILQKTNITRPSTASNIKEAGILPQAFHQPPADFRLQQKSPKAGISTKAQIPLKSRKLGPGDFNSLAESRDRIIKLKGKWWESKTSPFFMFSILVFEMFFHAKRTRFVISFFCFSPSCLRGELSNVTAWISGFQEAKVTKRTILPMSLGGKYTLVLIYCMYFNWAELPHGTTVIFVFGKYFEFWVSE